MEEKDKSTITPSQYFDYLKGAKKNITTESLKDSYGVFLSLAEKYDKLGQKESMKKLTFLVDTLIKEEKLIEMGITTYIYKDTIEDYITNVANKTVKIIELSRYMREVPDDLVDTVTRTKGIFDEFYVVFTDYTGREERKVEKERRDKDPILFGVFKNSANVADRFYFLGDWVDEYCDLTLDKMIDEYREKNGISPTVESKIPETSEELLGILKTYSKNEKAGSYTLTTSSFTTGMDDVSLEIYTNAPTPNSPAKKESFFDKVRSVFSKK